jgi:hypothetical protein
VGGYGFGDEELRTTMGKWSGERGVVEFVGGEEGDIRLYFE